MRFQNFHVRTRLDIQAGKRQTLPKGKLTQRNSLNKKKAENHNFQFSWTLTFFVELKNRPVFYCFLWLLLFESLLKNIFKKYICFESTGTSKHMVLRCLHVWWMGCYLITFAPQFCHSTFSTWGRAMSKIITYLFTRMFVIFFKQFL